MPPEATRTTRPNPVTIPLFSNQLEAQAVIRSTLVVEEPRPAAIGRHKNIEGAVVVNVRIGRAARHLRTRKSAAHLRRHLLKFPATEISEQMRRLGVRYPLLHALDLVFDVPVGNEN